VCTENLNPDVDGELHQVSRVRIDSLHRFWLEVEMVSKGQVSNDFRKQVLGYGLTMAEIVYRRPDRHWLLQTYVWQDYDMFPNFPALKDFLTFWETTLEGPLQLPSLILS
jgi:uncharacterized protein Usg